MKLKPIDFAKGTLRRNLPGQVAFLAVDEVADLVRLALGSIDGREFGCRLAENAGGAAAGLGGAAAGAAIGSLICPGPGTALGATLGGLFGSLGGRHGAGRIVR